METRKPPPEWQRESARTWRTRRRLPRETGFMLIGEPARRLVEALARSLPRQAAIISQNSAAECRRAYLAGDRSGLRFARFALDRARRDHERWLKAGGGLP